MHTYTQDLDLGRQATMWDGWRIDEGMALLPRLWQYTFLRCSLTSQADQYPETAFRLLVLLERKQVALGLAELLTNPAKKVLVLLQIAEQLREQASQESEWLEILMRAGEVARTIGTIQDSDQQAEALRALGTILAEAGQEEQASQVWAEAERVIGTIQGSSHQARALRALGTILVEAGQWAEAERVIGTIRDSDQKAGALSALATGMASADELEQLMHLMQRLWRQVETREEALSLFSIVSAVISHKPEVGIPFFDAFTWVDKFLGG